MSMTAASEDPQAGSSQSQSTAASATLEVMDRLREINLSEAQVVTSPGESKQHETTITYGTEPAEACSSPRATGGHGPGPLGAEPHDDKQLSPSLSMGDSPQAGEEAREMNNLFVGDLSRHCTEEQLRNTFAKYGEIVLVDIKRDKVSRNNLGYGFVQFKTHAQAAAAKEALNNTEICGRAVRLGWAQKNTTLFVGDLDGKTTTEQLRAAFSKLGPVVDDETFVAIGGKFGFVRYKYRPDAERAKVEMNGYVLGSKSIRIGWGDNNIQKHCVHIKFNGVEANGVSEGDFRAHFEQAGRVASVTLPRYIDGVYKGFGFIHFEDNDEGERAAGKSICTLTDTKVAGQVLVRCSYGKKPATKARASPGKQDRTFPASVRRREAPQYYDPYLMTEAYENQWSPYAPPSPQFYVHSNQSPATGTGVAHTMYVTEQTYYPPMYYTMVMHESPGKPVSPVPGSLEASPQLHVSPQLAHRSLPLHKAMHQSPQPGLRMLAPPSQVQVHQPPLQQYVAPPVPESYYPVQQPHPSMYPYRAVPAPTYVHGVSQPMLPSDKI